MRRNARALSVLAICFWIGVWWVAALVVNNALLLPTPLLVACTFVEQLGTVSFWLAVLVSIAEIVASFVTAFASALILAYVASALPWCKTLMSPVITCLKSIPVACITVILLIWTGPYLLIAAVVFLVVFPAYYLATLEAYDSFSAPEKHRLLTLGYSLPAFVCSYLFPHVLGYLKAVSKSVCAMSWKAAIAAQVIGLVGTGLGDALYRAKVLLDPAKVFAITLAIVLLSAVFERLWLLVLDGLAKCVTLLGLHAKSPKLAQVPVALNDPAVAVGELALLTGASGAGKTTTLNRTWKATQERAGYLMQTTNLPPYLTPCQTIAQLVPNTCERQELLQNLFPNGVPKNINKTLSGGEQRMLALGLVLASSAPTLLLDEPFSGMDPDTKKVAILAILSYANKRPTLVALHTADDASALSAKHVYTIES